MSAISDIKLRPGQVVVDAWDLVVDSPDRRSNTTPQRRTLVHDYDDGLTINWAEDYPGGVTIQGELKADKVRAASVDLAGAVPRSLRTPGAGNDRLA